MDNTLKEIFEKYPKELLEEGFDFNDWLLDTDTFYINIGNDYALFQDEGFGICSGHFLFTEAKGKEAISVGRKIIQSLKKEYPFTVLKGLTPENNKAAKWVSRQLGFTSLGETTNEGTQCEVFFMNLKNEEI